MTHSGEFAGQVALITGGSRGIGRAVCERLARGGASVAVNYRRDEAAASATLDAVESLGGRAALFQADVADEASVAAMVREVETSLGPIDMLVANAGIHAVESPDAPALATLQRIMRVNVDGVFVPLMAVKDGMIARGRGSIVCMASVAALRPRPMVMAYSASKAAVISLVRSAADAYGPEIRVNAIAPGFIDTDMTAGSDQSRRRAMAEDAALKRIGEPAEIAEATAFLLSSAAGFVSGQTWVVDGGRIMLP